MREITPDEISPGYREVSDDEIMGMREVSDSDIAEIDPTQLLDYRPEIVKPVKTPVAQTPERIEREDFLREQEYSPDDIRSIITSEAIQGNKQKIARLKELAETKPKTRQEYEALKSEYDTLFSEVEDFDDTYKMNYKTPLWQLPALGLKAGLKQLGEWAGTSLEMAAGEDTRTLGPLDDTYVTWDQDKETYERVRPASKARENLKRIGKETAQFWKPDPLPAGIEGSILDDPALALNPGWILYNTAQVATSIIPGIGGGYVAGRVIAPALAKMTPKVASRLMNLSQALGGGFVGGSQERVGTYRDLIEAGLSEAEATRGANAMWLASGVLNAISFGKAFGEVEHITRYLKTGSLKSYLQFARHGLKKAPGAGVTEAITEYLEEPSEVAIKAWKIPGYSWEQASEQLKQGFNVTVPSFIVGALTGGFVGAAQDKAHQAYIHDYQTSRAMDRMKGEVDSLPDRLASPVMTQEEYKDVLLRRREKLLDQAFREGGENAREALYYENGMPANTLGEIDFIDKHLSGELFLQDYADLDGINLKEEIPGYLQDALKHGKVYELEQYRKYAAQLGLTPGHVEMINANQVMREFEGSKTPEEIQSVISEHEAGNLTTGQTLERLSKLSYERLTDSDYGTIATDHGLEYGGLQGTPDAFFPTFVDPLTNQGFKVEPWEVEGNDFQRALLTKLYNIRDDFFKFNPEAYDGDAYLEDEYSRGYLNERQYQWAKAISESMKKGGLRVPIVNMPFRQTTANGRQRVFDLNKEADLQELRDYGLTEKEIQDAKANNRPLIIAAEVAPGVGGDDVQADGRRGERIILYHEAGAADIAEEYGHILADDAGVTGTRAEIEAYAKDLAKKLVNAHVRGDMNQAVKEFRKEQEEKKKEAEKKKEEKKAEKKEEKKPVEHVAYSVKGGRPSRDEVKIFANEFFMGQRAALRADGEVIEVNVEGAGFAGVGPVAKITRGDVADFVNTPRNMSGMGRLAGMSGSYRQIVNVAAIAQEWFEAFDEKFQSTKEKKDEPTRLSITGKEARIPGERTGAGGVPSEVRGIKGSDISRPLKSYAEAKDGNPWVRIAEDTSNEDRSLMITFSSDPAHGLFPGKIDEMMKYYNKMYADKRKGYVKPKDFWELPQWMTNIAYFTDKADVYVVRDMKEAKAFLKKSGYGRISFSLMDVNKDMTRELIEDFKGTADLGGREHFEKDFKDLSNVKWHPDYKSLANDLGVEYKDGVDFKHFKGTAVIPRFTMSQGCLYRCAFCEIPKKLTKTSKESIDQQADAIGELGAELVYVNDKTFGQADNWKYLADVYERIKKINPDFHGFVVQTTARDFLKINRDWLSKSGIKYVEFGVESYNDFILKSLHKPHNEGIIDQAVQKLRDVKINLVPNIIIGIKEETGETYKRTLDFLKKNLDIISHANIYNLALYEGTELREKLGAKAAADIDEGVTEKSFHTDKQIHLDFSKQIFEVMSERLDKPAAYSIRTSIDKTVRKEMRDIVAAARKNKSYLQAPNGAPTLLSKENWALVRTRSFKNWFGDWEEFSKKGGVWYDDKGEVSKVVDKNGEPLVVFHGTKQGGYSVFDPDKRDKHATPAIFFTDNDRMAGTYGGTQEIHLPILKTQKDLEDIGWEFDTKDDGYIWGYAPDGSLMIEEKGLKKAVAAALVEQGGLPAQDIRGQYSSFLNIRNPYEENFEGVNWDGTRFDEYVVIDEAGEYVEGPEGDFYMTETDAINLADETGGTADQAPGMGYDTNHVVAMAKREKHDGAIIREVTDSGGVPSGYGFEPADVFVIFKPEQAKSATQNVGTFKGEDMRYSIPLYSAVYHGGPNLWKPEKGFPHGRPRLDKIGTGEGSQAYGWGIYLADAEAVGKRYEEATKERPYPINIIIGTVPVYRDGRPADYSPHQFTQNPKAEDYARAGIQEDILIEEYRLKDGYEKDGVEGVKKELRKIIQEKLELVEEERQDEVPFLKDLLKKVDSAKIKFEEPQSFLYKLDVPDEIQKKLLLWDRPISEHSETVQKLLAKTYKYAKDTPRFKLTGEELYRRISKELESEEAAAKLFADIGIPGLKFLDQASRQKVKDQRPFWPDDLKDYDATYNYVIWDQKALDKIALLERNGERIEAAKDAYYSIGAAPEFAGRKVTLTHWTTKKDLKKTYPRYVGTGSQGAEKFRPMEPQTYFGTEDYTLEAFVRGPLRYSAVIDGDKVYDFEKDPLNLYPTDTRMKKAGAQVTEIKTRRYLYEKDIKKAGWEGIYVRSRGVVAMFVPVALTPETPSNKAVKDPFNVKEQYSIKSPAFERWFGDSKVVDENGKPLVVYHGTPKSKAIREFKVPAYFTEEPTFAEMFGDTIYPVYLRIEHPYTLDASEGGRHFEWDDADVARMKREGYDGVIVRGGEDESDIYTVFDKEQIKSATGNIGTYDPENPDIRYAIKDKGAKILYGQGVKKFDTIYQIGSYLNRRKYIDYSTATEAENREVENLLKNFLEASIHKHPEALGWYRGDIETTLEILRDMDPNLKKPAHSFMLRLAVALSSNGNKGVKTISMGYSAYKNWADTGTYLPTEDSDRGKTIRAHFELAGRLRETFKTELAFEKWLLSKRPSREINEDIKERLGITVDLVKGESPDEIVPTASLFGPKLGAFFANLSGDFTPLTMDRWKMRTIGRITGDLLLEGDPQPLRDRLKKTLTPEVLKLFWDDLGATDIETITDDDLDAIGLRINRGAWRALQGKFDDVRTAGNALGKLLKGGLRDAPRGPKHRKWIRERMERALRSRPDLHVADSQAGMWIGEKEVYSALGGQREQADFYSDGARALYRKLKGELPGRFAGTTGGARRTDPGGSETAPLFSIKDADYLKAVESGDMKTAQKMVDEAAKKAGYNIGPVYHGSPNKGFHEFQIPSKGFNSNVFGSWEVERNAAFFSTDENEAREFSEQGGVKTGEVRRFLLSGDFKDLREGISAAFYNSVESKGVNGRWLLGARNVWEYFDKEQDPDGTLVKAMKEMGYDGAIIEEEGVVYVVFSPTQIKSADPVTYDDNGKVIPLSERFKETSPDIRYSIKFNIPEIAKRVKANPDGYTINVETGELETTGYAVAPTKLTETAIVNPSPEDIKNFLERFRAVYEADPRAKLGGWLQGDETILDVAYVFDTLGEAIDVAEAGDQKAIFHLDTFREIKTPVGIEEAREANEYRGKRDTTLKDFVESQIGEYSIKSVIRKSTGQYKPETVTLKEYIALRDQLKFEARAAKDAFAAGRTEEGEKLKARYKETIEKMRQKRREMNEIGRMIEDLKKLKLEKMSPDYAKKIREILEPFDLTKLSEAKRLKLQAIKEELETNPDAEFSPDMVEALERLDKTAVRDLPLADFRLLYNSIMHFATLGKRGPLMIVAQRKIAREMVMQESLKEFKPIKEIADELVDISYSRGKSYKGALGAVAHQFGLHNIAWEALVEGVAGPQSVYYEIMYRHIKEGIYERDRIKYELEDELGDAMLKWSEKHGVKDIAKWLDEKVTFKNMTMKRNQLLSLYRGSQDEG